MRGDGGATNAEGFRREPARTLYSGPAASVAGVLRFSRLRDGVIVEVGGTSTNVAAVRDGRPALSYVQVASHTTALRALDVRVVRRRGWIDAPLTPRVHVRCGTTKRAHLADLPYSCYLEHQHFDGALAEVIHLAPVTRPNTLRFVYVGTLAALTNTCATIRLGVVAPTDYAATDADFEWTARGVRRGASSCASRARRWHVGCSSPPRKSSAIS